jgi:hypothetical protein
VSTIGELKKAILDPNIPLSATLRHAKVLAVELNSCDMEEWVDKEMNGYDSEKDTIPKYRELPIQSIGDFAGPYQSGLKNAPIPTFCLPEHLREWAETHQELNSVRALESTIETSRQTEEEMLSLSWPANLTAMISKKVYRGKNCIWARKTVTRAQLEQIIEIVRNKLLDFVLILEKQYPNRSPNSLGENIETAKQITQVFNTTIYGDASNIVTAPQASGTISPTLQKGAVNVSKTDANQQSHICGDASIEQPQKRGLWKMIIEFFKAIAN